MRLYLKRSGNIRENPSPETMKIPHGLITSSLHRYKYNPRVLLGSTQAEAWSCSRYVVPEIHDCTSPHSGSILHV